MEKVMLFLLKVNDKLYNFPSHIIILSIWITALISGPPLVKGWFLLGVFIWAFMMVIRSIQGGSIKEVIEKNGYLPLLVGLNLCTVLSILSFPIMWMLSLLTKEK